MKRFFLVIAIIVGVIFANGCYFVFFGQMDATRKVVEGKRLNVYETFSAYTMHTATWLFGWPFFPQTAKVTFNMQFHTQPSSKRIVGEDPFAQHPYISNLKKSIAVGQKRYLAFANYTNNTRQIMSGEFVSGINLNANDIRYTNDVETLLNGGYLERLSVNTWRYYAVCNYAPGVVTIGPFRISETLFDYLERVGIIKPYVWEIIVDT